MRNEVRGPAGVEQETALEVEMVQRQGGKGSGGQRDDNAAGDDGDAAIDGRGVGEVN